MSYRDLCPKYNPMKESDEISEEKEGKSRTEDVFARSSNARKAFDKSFTALTVKKYKWIGNSLIRCR